jgi:hypothetical protein
MIRCKIVWPSFTGALNCSEESYSILFRLIVDIYRWALILAHIYSDMVVVVTVVVVKKKFWRRDSGKFPAKPSPEISPGF